MKNIYLIILYLFLGLTALSAQPQTPTEKLNLIKIEEQKIKDYSVDCANQGDYFDEFQMYIENISVEFPNGEIPPDIYDQLKSKFIKKYCRKQYFLDFPQAWNAYRGVFRSPQEECESGGFDNGFNILLDQLSYDQSFDSQCSDMGINSAEVMSTSEHIEVITSGGSDPNIPGLSFASAPFIKLNYAENNINDDSAIKFSRAHILTASQEKVFFDFAISLFYSLFHPANENAFFMTRAVRVYDGAIFDQQCIVANPSDPRLSIVSSLPQGDILSTNGWDCNFFQLEGVPGDSFYLEFIITDCLIGGHFGYVYIDNIYAESCDEVVVCTDPDYGNVFFTDPTDPVCFSDFPRQICGQYYAPIDSNGTPFTANNLTLHINNLSGTHVTNGVIPIGPHNTSTGEFCFDVAPSHFPNLTGEFEFEVEIDFSLDGYSQTLSHSSTTYGADVGPCETDCSCLDDATCSYTIDGCNVSFTANAGNTDCNLLLEWDFDNNPFTIEATGPNPVWVFEGPGPHCVLLIITDQNGDCTERVIEHCITLPNCSQVDCSCVADADFDYVTDECTGFFQAIPGDPTCTDLEYAWDFNGDSAPDLFGMSVTWEDFDGPGPHLVSLTVSDVAGECDAITISQFINTPGCVACECVANADFDFTINGCDVAINFNSGGPGCDLVYKWYLNGDLISMTMNPIIEVMGEGPHTITLILAETTGQCDSLIITETVSTPGCFDCDCVAEADFEFNINGCEVEFTTLPGGGDCDGLIYSWDFDGNGTEDSNEMNPTHEFNGPGPHTVILTISDATGMCDINIITHMVSLPECPDCTCTAEASFTFTTNECDIYFFATPGPGSCDLTYSWDFGDGSPNGTGQNLTHSYDGPGPYSVTLTVSAPGCSDEISELVSAPNCCGDGGAAIIIIRSSFESACVDNNPCKPREKGCDPGTIDDECFQACEGSTVIYYIEDPAPGSTYVWEVLGGDMTIVDISSISVDWPLIPMGSTSLDGLITVTEITSGGCETTGSRCVEITETPKAGFSAIPEIACINQSIQFINESIGDELSYLWNFGDGTFSILESPTHSYGLPAIYEVQLIAVNACGCADTFLLDVKINDQVSHQVECIGTVCAGDIVDYNLIFGDVGCDPSDVDIEWEVEGGEIQSSQGTQFITIKWYSNPLGEISVTVHGCGCSTTITQEVPIITNNLTLFGPDVACVGEEVTYYTECQPGRAFHWTITGGVIISQNQLLNEVVVQFDVFGTQQISVTIDDNEVLNCAELTPLTLTQSVAVIPHGEIRPLEEEFCAEVLSEVIFEVVVNEIPTTNIYFWSLINSAGGTVNSSFGNTYSIPVGVIVPAGAYTVQAVISPTDPPVLCNSIITHYITVQPKPVEPEYIGGEELICTGKTYTYTANPDANHLILWEIVGGSVGGSTTATGSEVAVTWGNSPPFELYVHQFNPQSGACLSDPVQVIIQAIDASNYGVYYGSLDDPAPIPGPSNVCIGRHAFHTDAEAIVYEWSVVPAYLGSIVSGQFSNDVEIAFHYDENITPPYDNVIVRLAADICGEEIMYEYTIDIEKPLVIIDGPSDACVGSEASFNANLLPTGVSALYSWFVNDMPVASGPLASLDYNFESDGVHSLVVEVVITDPAFACQGSIFSAATSINVSYPFGINVIGYTYPDGCLDTYTVEAPASSGGPYNYVWTDQSNVIFTENGVTNSILSITAGNAPDGQVTITVVDPNNPECIITETVPGRGCGGGPGGDDPCIGHSVFSQLTRSCDDYSASFELIIVPGEEFHHFDFGDGNSTSTFSSIISHTYTDPGLYIVKLYIEENGNICLAHSLTIDVRFPNPTFNLPAEVCEMTPININNTSDLGSIVEIIWDFGDNSNSNETSPTKTYQDVTSMQNYPITLTLVDEYGCENDFTQNVAVHNNDLVDNLIILPSEATEVCANLILTAVPDGSAPYTYDWFSGTDPSSSIGSTVSQNVTESGQYIVEVSDTYGCIARVNSEFMTIHPQPIPLYSGATQYCAGDSIRLVALSGDQFSYEWSSSWGDVSTAENFISLAPSAGAHTVTLTVTNSTPIGDCEASTVVSISVHGAPVVQIVQPFACAPELVEVLNPVPEYEYFWSNGTLGTSTTALIPSVIQVTAINDVGCKGYDEIPVSEGINFCNMMVGCYELCPDVWLAPPGYVSYQWYEINDFGDLIPIPAPTGTDSILDLTIVGEGSYQVMVTDIFGCSGLSEIVHLQFDLSDCEPRGKPCALQLKDPEINLGQVKCLGEWGGKQYYTVIIPYYNETGNSGEIILIDSPFPNDVVTLISSTFILGGSNGFIEIIIGVDDTDARGMTLHYLDATGKKCKVDFKIHFPDKCNPVKPCEKMSLKASSGSCAESNVLGATYDVSALIHIGNNSIYGMEAIVHNPDAMVVSSSFSLVGNQYVQVDLSFNMPGNSEFNSMCFDLIFELGQFEPPLCIFKFCVKSFDHICLRSRNLLTKNEGIFDDFTFYPNPTTGNFYLGQHNFQKENDIEVEVYNAQGRIVHAFIANAQMLQTKGINLKGSPEGMYFIRLNAENSTKTMTIVKIE